MNDTPETLMEAVRYFADLDRCEDYLRRLRWPGGKPVCPECGSRKIGEIKTRRLLRCKDCRRQIYTKRGTIFEASPLGLDKWFVAVWCVANCKNGISSHELARAIGVQPSQVRAIVLAREDAETLIGDVRRRVKAGAGVYTDEAMAYSGLVPSYVHAAIDHSREYVIGNVHTNGMENFWTLLKRSLGGTYVAVAPYHLYRYVAEQVFRFNERHGSDADRFAEVLSRVFGRRLTYRVLTGKDGAGFMGLE